MRSAERAGEAERERRCDDEAAAENVSATAEKGEDLRGKRRRGRHIHDRIFVMGDSVGCSIGAGTYVKKNCRRSFPSNMYK